MKVKFLLLLLLAASQTVRADFYGLSIGIDQYKNVSSLDGAVNDAKIIADSLSKIGAKKVKLLLNEQASRDEIKKAWDELTKEAKNGDTIFFSYAGHGAQQNERIPNTEADGKDEFYVLPNFDVSGASTYERIMDDDLQDWFSKVPNLNVILVSDSCHSGTMTRGYKKSNLKYRRIPNQTINDDALPPIENKKIADERITILNNVVSFSAVPDQEEVPEVRIGNEQHGALSWHLAQGLLGFADKNKDGSIELTEIKDYLIERVRMETAGQQHPQINFKKNQPLVALRAAVFVSTNPLPSLDSLPFAVTHPTPQTDNILGQLKGITLVTDNSATLTWDTEENAFKNRFGDTVYSLSTHSTTKGFKRSDPETGGSTSTEDTAKALQAVVNKFLFVERAKRLSDASLKIALKPDDKLHAEGESITFVTENLRYPHFTLFNLATDGTINFLYPNAEMKDPLKVPTNKPYQLKLVVSAPFGADDFIAIASGEPLTPLHESLKQMDNRILSFDNLSKALTDSLQDSHYQIGTHASFTTEKK
jgi:hypothetical protein